MNPGRLALAVLGGFVFLFASDYLIHELWLAADYKASAELWRAGDEIHRRLVIIFIGQFLCALAFLYIWARTGWRRRSILDGCSFGFWMGLFHQVSTLVLYVILPMRKELAVKWLIAGMVQAILFGALASLLYKPRPILGDRRP